MQISLRFSLVLAALFLNGCYTPRDVRPAAVAEAKATAERDLPKLAAAVASGSRERDRLTAQFETYLTRHPGVYGVALAPVPAGTASALYVYRRPGGFGRRELAPPIYDYQSMEWYRRPLEIGGAHWSQPYFDREGGNVWMQTYSMPIAGGVITNDVPVYGAHNN